MLILLLGIYLVSSKKRRTFIGIIRLNGRKETGMDLDMDYEERTECEFVLFDLGYSIEAAKRLCEGEEGFEGSSQEEFEAGL
jgi:hypothetical protein